MSILEESFSESLPLSVVKAAMLGTPVQEGCYRYYVLDADANGRPLWIGRIVDQNIDIRKVQLEISKWRKSGWQVPSTKWFEKMYGRYSKDVPECYQNMISRIEQDRGMKLNDFWTSTRRFYCNTPEREVYGSHVADMWFSDPSCIGRGYDMVEVVRAYADDIKRMGTLMVVKKCRY